MQGPVDDDSATLLTTVDLLGGARAFSHVPITRLEWIQAVRAGFPFSCAALLAHQLGITNKQLAIFLNVSPVTLARRRASGVLTKTESAHILRIARTLSRAIAIFEAQNAAVDWLKCHNRALGGTTPLSLLDTEFGAEEVHCVLGRIEHGVFS